jgi:NADPH-dependent curcumin reductase CurA
MTTSRQWHLIRRPHGVPVDEDFALVDVELPVPGDGEITVRNRFLSVDPYMRGRMSDVKSYVPPFQLDQPMDGQAVGVVEQVSEDTVDGNGSAIAIGDTVIQCPAGGRGQWFPPAPRASWTPALRRRRPTWASSVCRA